MSAVSVSRARALLGRCGMDLDDQQIDELVLAGEVLATFVCDNAEALSTLYADADESIIDDRVTALSTLGS